ncbi:MAG TPA: DegT/DnrJ/EryC1/StrS family aminotransferase [Thermoanaerobaculia bacterium]|nr:DegT/DnrJ/EryC1/StrS family aminotransferase [Thermoanaerobaculia bacterium]
MTPTRVPLFDLRPAAAALEGELLERWRRLLTATSFVGGDEVAAFEEGWARFLGAPASVGVANGTDALVLALRALGVRPGDEVVVPAFTFFATAEAVAWAGATPVCADVDAATLQIDPADAAARVGRRTVGLIAVHLYGQPCALDAIAELCDRRGLWLVEDAAQAHGATFDGRRVGTFGRLAGWSFYPSKNLGCFGDGGAVTGADAGALARVRLLANHGRLEQYTHGALGTNSRLDALQAAVLNLRLAGLEAANERRRAIAARYLEALAGVGDLRFVATHPQGVGVYHQMTVRTAARDPLRRHLGEQGIGTAVFYPLPLHRQPAFADRRVPSLPVAEAAAGEVLCLPIYPQLADDAVDRVCAAVRAFYGD